MSGQIALYTDAILVMASLGAALFCLRLQVQLRRLQRLDRGVGQAILAMTEATRASQAAAAAIRGEVEESIRQLDERYGDLEARRREVDDLLDTMEGQMTLQVKRCHEARQLTEQALTPLVHKAEMELHALTKALEVSTRLSSLKSRMADTERPREDDVDVLRSSLERDAAARNNPFLRAVNG